MRKTIALAVLALAACGKPADKGVDGQEVAESKASAAAGANVRCDNLPEFVALAEPKAVTFCTQGEAQAGHISGTVMYRTAMTPDAVIAFYRARAKAAGIPDSLSNPDATGQMYSARDGTKRSFMAIAVPQKDGSDVTLNWGKDK